MKIFFIIFILGFGDFFIFVFFDLLPNRMVKTMKFILNRIKYFFLLDIYKGLLTLEEYLNLQ